MTEITEKTAEQIAEEKAAEKEAKERAKAEAKAKREAAAAERKAEREALRAAKQAEREAEKARIKAEREANRMPEQNGVRRPKPETLCGRAWAIFDEVSQQNGAPASIGEALQLSRAQGLNDGNVRAEYARWRKFHGITGRIASPKTEVVEAEVAETAE